MNKATVRSQKSAVRGKKKIAFFRDYDRAFTLLELMISITLLTMVILIIGNVFRIGMNAWEKGEEETGWTQRFRVLSGLFSQQFKSVYPYMMEIDDENVVLFSGEADSVLFVTTLAESSYGGFKWVRYSHKDGTIFLKEGLLPDKELMDNISGDEEIVDSYIEELKFEYKSHDDEWNDSWDYGEVLPKAIKVKIPYFEPFLITIPMSTVKEEGVEEG
jgi:general secretion pathway protein J